MVEYGKERILVETASVDIKGTLLLEVKIVPFGIVYTSEQVQGT